MYLLFREIHLRTFLLYLLHNFNGIVDSQFRYTSFRLIYFEHIYLNNINKNNIIIIIEEEILNKTVTI